MIIIFLWQSTIGIKFKSLSDWWQYTVYRALSSRHQLSTKSTDGDALVLMPALLTWHNSHINTGCLMHGINLSVYRIHIYQLFIFYTIRWNGHSEDTAVWAQHSILDGLYNTRLLAPVYTVLCPIWSCKEIKFRPVHGMTEIHNIYW